jgi:hypothetical protein
MLTPQQQQWAKENMVNLSYEQFRVRFYNKPNLDNIKKLKLVEMYGYANSAPKNEDTIIKANLAAEKLKRAQWANFDEISPTVEVIKDLFPEAKEVEESNEEINELDKLEKEVKFKHAKGKIIKYLKEKQVPVHKQDIMNQASNWGHNADYLGRCCRWLAEKGFIERHGPKDEAWYKYK